MAPQEPTFAAFTELVEHDPWLGPYVQKITGRLAAVSRRECKLLRPDQTLADFASAHEYFGLHKRQDCWELHEWAPNASGISLVGDFSEWREEPRFALHRLNAQGVWELRLPLDALKHGDFYKLKMHWWEGGEEKAADRLPAYVR